MGTLSGYYSTVQKILSRVTANTMKEFAALTSDEERVAYVLSQDYVREAFRVTPQVDVKSAIESRKWREKGNLYYQKGRYGDALDIYNRALIMAPVDPQVVDNPEELVLALGNRSATLYQMQDYAPCLVDIDLALQLGYPDNLLYKLHDRRGRCYFKMGRDSEAKSTFEEVLDVLRLSRLDANQRETVTLNTQKQIARCSQRLLETSTLSSAVPREVNGKDAKLTPGVNLRVKSEAPDISGQPSKMYPCASSEFHVKYSPEKGRYAVMSREVIIGETLLVETPHVSVLDAEQHSKRCLHCFQNIGVPFPCHMCTRVRYCSEKCRKESWASYHQVECPYVTLLVNSGTGNIAHLALRTVIQAGPDTILSCLRHPNANSQGARTSLFISNGMYLGGYVGLYNLQEHSGHRDANDQLQYAILAVYLLKILDSTPFFKHANVGMNEASLRTCIGGVILRFLQLIACNGIDITQMHVGASLSKTDPQTIGLGLFPTVSLINHSCDPNAEFIFYGNRCAVRCIQAISRGGDLSVDYGYLYYVTAREQRQISLKAQYFFTCRCNACARHWSIKANMRSDIPVLQCRKCAAPLHNIFDMSPDATEAPDPTKYQCRKCLQMQNPLEVYEKVQKATVLYERALEQARGWDIRRALPILEHHLRLLANHVVLPWKDYVTCLSTLKQCYRMMGNRDTDPPPLLT